MSKFTVGQQVKVIGNRKDMDLSLMLGMDLMAHAVPNGEVVTITEVEGGGVYVDTTEVNLLSEFANKDRQWLRADFVEAV